jgi:hypothetical protein
VVSVTSTGEHAVATPELLSHAPRSENSKHEADENAGEIYVSKLLSRSESALSADLDNLIGTMLVVVGVDLKSRRFKSVFHS